MVQILAGEGRIFLIALVVLFVLLFITARQNRRRLPGGPPRTCGSCGEKLPNVARFCSRCGRRV